MPQAEVQKVEAQNLVSEKLRCFLMRSDPSADIGSDVRFRELRDVAVRMCRAGREQELVAADGKRHERSRRRSRKKAVRTLRDARPLFIEVVVENEDSPFAQGAGCGEQVMMCQGSGVAAV